MVATISAITSGSSRVSYFEKDGYYVDGDPEHRQLSRWHGQGAVELGLTSINPSGDYRARSVSSADFEAILDGRIRYGKNHATNNMDVDLALCPKTHLSVKILSFGKKILPPLFFSRKLKRVM
jgi:hypothetical protein